MWLRHINELLSTISYFSQHVIPLNDCSRQTCTLRYVQFQINQKSLEFWNSLWFIESHQTINALTFSWIPLFFSNLYLWIVSTQISSSTFVRCKQILDWMRKTYFTIIFGCFFVDFSVKFGILKSCHISGMVVTFIICLFAHSFSNHHYDFPNWRTKPTSFSVDLVWEQFLMKNPD